MEHLDRLAAGRPAKEPSVGALEQGCTFLEPLARQLHQYFDHLRIVIQRTLVATR